MTIDATLYDLEDYALSVSYAREHTEEAIKHGAQI